MAEGATIRTRIPRLRGIAGVQARCLTVEANLPFTLLQRTRPPKCLLGGQMAVARGFEPRAPLRELPVSNRALSATQPCYRNVHRSNPCLRSTTVAPTCQGVFSPRIVCATRKGRRISLFRRLSMPIIYPLRGVWGEMAQTPFDPSATPVPYSRHSKRGFSPCSRRLL